MYRTVAQIDSVTNLLATWFPQVFTRVRLPQTSVLGADVYALRLRAGGGATTRRGVLIVGGTHARELMNPDAIVEFAIDLLTSYLNETDIRYGGRTWPAADVKLIVEAMDIWLVPCINPDGRTHVLTVDDLWRKNRRDNPGTSCDGVDLNRNADVVWGVAQGQTSCSPCAETYCGPSAFSEPETRNVRHLLDTERIVSFVDVHSYSELVLYPWGHAPTQSADPSLRFTGLATGTCTASIPAGYAEYMPPRDVQRFTTVAGRIVSDVAAVRGRTYTAQTSRALYATTGSQSDYAYARHIANPSLQKTYGFTFETGPWAGNARDSFHPADPTLIKRDTKAALLALLQQSVCAIDLIGSTLFDGRAELAMLRRLRDEHLAATAAGRQWIALFERMQFALMLALRQEPTLMMSAIEVIQSVAKVLADDAAAFTDADAKRASGLVRQLRAAVKLRALREDLDAVRGRIDELRGRRTPQVVASLVRRKPGAAGVATQARAGTPAPARKARRR
jgi:murein tripeptide amidase MpaA